LSGFAARDIRIRAENNALHTRARFFTSCQPWLITLPPVSIWSSASCAPTRSPTSAS